MTGERQLVYIVNSDICIRTPLQALLADHGLNAISFDSASAFLSYPQPDLPACLLLDIDLPDMCGLDLQREVANVCSPVIFVTRRADIAMSVRAIKAGALDFLTIPFKTEQLLLSVKAAIDCDAHARAERERMNGLRERLARLTRRERQVLAMIVSGMLNKQVASTLGISEITVQIHRGRVMQKMGASSFADLVRIAETLRIPLSIGPRILHRHARSAPPMNLAAAGGSYE